MNPRQTGEYEINGATALGLMEDVNYPDIEFQLHHDTSLIMYTDGISEAHDGSSAQYTDTRLTGFIDSIQSTDAEVLGNSVINSVDDFAADTQQFDDITLLIIRYA